MLVYEFYPSIESLDRSLELREALGNFAIFMSPPWAARFTREYQSDANISAQHIADTTGATVLGLNERSVRPSLRTISPTRALIRLMDEAKYQTDAIRKHLEPEQGRFGTTINYGQSLAGSMAAARATIDDSSTLIMHEPLPSHIRDISLWRGIYEHFGYELKDQPDTKKLDPELVLPSEPEQTTQSDKHQRTRALIKGGLEDTFGTGQRMTAPLLWPILLDAVYRKPHLNIFSEYAALSKALSHRVGIGITRQRSFLEDSFVNLRSLQAQSQERLFYEQGKELEIGKLAWSVTPHTTHASYDNTEFRASRIRSALTELVA